MTEKDRKIETAINIDKIISIFQSVVENISDYYSVVYDSIPEIERNLELTEQETNVLLDYLIDVDSDDLLDDDNEKKAQQLIAAALQEIQRDFAMINEKILDQDKIMNILDGFVNEDTRKISFRDLMAVAAETDNVLDEVNIMSFNAIIFSSNQSNGRAFSVIAQEIQSISNNLEDKYDNISMLLGLLSDWHSLLKQDVEQIIDLQLEVRDLYDNKLGKTFLKMTDSIQVTNEILGNIIDNVNKVVDPFQELMVLIQKEDIVQQNIANIIHSLNVIKDKYSKYNALELTEKCNIEKLDLLQFVRQGLELINNLTQMTFDELFNSIDDISGIIDRLLSGLAEVKNDAHYISAHLSSNERHESSRYSESSKYRECPKHKGSIDISFNSVINLINDFTDKLNQINQVIESNNTDNNNFFSYIRELEDEIGQVRGQVNSLKRLEILGRIELSRIGGENTGFRSQLKQNVEKVISITGENTDKFLNIKPVLESELEKFNQVLNTNQQNIDKASRKINNSLEKIETTNTILNQAVYALYSEIEYLEKNLIEVASKLKNVEELRRKGSLLQEKVDDYCSLINQEWDNITEYYQVNKWNLKDSDLKEIVEQFTTYLERETGNQYLEIEKKSGDSTAGELTLF